MRSFGAFRAARLLLYDKQCLSQILLFKHHVHNKFDFAILSSLLYDLPGGSQVDGLPPVTSRQLHFLHLLNRFAHSAGPMTKSLAHVKPQGLISIWLQNRLPPA